MHGGGAMRDGILGLSAEEIARLEAEEMIC
jgi:hypothetical protein